jgi:hypothetical protein
LRTLLLENGTGHLSLAVELELEEGSPGVLELVDVERAQ